MGTGNIEQEWHISVEEEDDVQNLIKEIVRDKKETDKMD